MISVVTGASGKQQAQRWYGPDWVLEESQLGFSRKQSPKIGFRKKQALCANPGNTVGMHGESGH